MGRAPKHLTLQEKLEARKAAKRRYAASARGIHMKSAQNARASQRRTAKNIAGEREGSAAMVDKHPKGYIPDDLVAVALRPLCSSRLFNLALGSADALDESDLGVWEARPPYYTLPAHQENEAERRFTEKMVQVIHGKRFRELRADGEDRVRRADAELQRLVEELEDRVAVLLAVCRDDAPDAIASALLPGSNRDLCMARLHHEWSARRLYCLHADLTILRKQGADEYRKMYRRKELAWQVIRVE